MGHCAPRYVEAEGDDLDIKFGVPFTKQFKFKEDETVFFSRIPYRSRAHRDRVNAKVMKDPRIAKMMTGQPTPFDDKPMVCGRFKVLVEPGQRA